ncbi:MAG TPA: transglutaminase-like domain-containing protein [Herpetosiphonaceae bacterium]|nr:transglutaminase-like domain-containing protein [Herpetosiphonaceae bacterium]
MADYAVFASQSVFTDPGGWASALDAVPSDIPAMARAARRLVFHYRADGDYAANGIAPERIAEIDTRYAAAMLGRLAALSDLPLTAERAPAQRLVGCCRDFTLLFLAIARHHGVPARARVGFASYFVPGWYLDHAVPEVWDGGEGRWRLVEAQIREGFVDRADNTPLDTFDLPRDRMVVGAQAWLDARSGRIPAERFAVDPGIEIPNTRGWPYLAHNLLLDLAALNKREMILWDSWGVAEDPEMLAPERLDDLDRLAAALLDPATSAAELAALYDRPGYRTPDAVTSYSPAAAIPLQVAIPIG